MSKSPVQRVLEQPKRRKYLMGWVAACHLANVAGDNVLYLTTPKRIGEVFADPKVFKSQDAAEKAIKAACPDTRLNKGNRIAIRKYIYETHIPEHAKGMPEWTEDDSTEWTFLN